MMGLATKHFTCAAAAQILLLPSSAHFVVLKLIILMWYARVTYYVWQRYILKLLVSNSFATTIYFKVIFGIEDMCVVCKVCFNV